MQNKRVPEIRFTGCSDDWKSEKLGRLANFSKGMGYSKNDLLSEGTPIILYGRLYTKYETIIDNVDTYTLMHDKSVLSEGNEIIVPASGESAEEISRASVIVNNGIILGGDLNIIKPNREVDSLFLALSITYGKPHKQLSSRAQGKSIVHLRNSDLQEIDLFYPQKDEQKKIGDFINAIEKRIILNQNELDCLKQMKQGFFQKMFPKEGEVVPELRFPGFTDDWEPNLLSNIANIVGGGTPSTDKGEYWNGNIDWYSPTEIGKNRYAEGSVKQITELGLKQSSAKILPADRTILFTSRAGIGDMAILKKDGATNQGFQSIIVNYEYDVYFIYSLKHKIKSYALKNASGSTFLEISGKTLGKIILLFPSLEEQTMIGGFFRKIDTTILLHKQELELLKQTKKAFLQKMFI